MQPLCIHRSRGWRHGNKIEPLKRVSGSECNRQLLHSLVIAVLKVEVPARVGGVTDGEFVQDTNGICGVMRNGIIPSAGEPREEANAVIFVRNCCKIVATYTASFLEVWCLLEKLVSSVEQPRREVWELEFVQMVKFTDREVRVLKV